MKFLFAAIVVVVMATKMAEPCCLPDQVKANVFFAMNTTVHAYGETHNAAVFAEGSFAVDFAQQRLALKIGKVQTVTNGKYEVALNSAHVVMDGNTRRATVFVDTPEMENPGCYSQTIQGRLGNEQKCFVRDLGLTPAATGPEGTIYQEKEDNVQLVIAVDKNCVTRLVSVMITMDDPKSAMSGSMTMQMAVSGTQLTTTAADFAPPCANPTQLPGVTKLPSGKDALKKGLSGMVANEMKKRRR